MCWPRHAGRETKRQLLHNIIMGCCGHMGEIEALEAMMQRRQNKPYYQQISSS